MVLENIGHYLDLHVLKCETLQDPKATKLSSLGVQKREVSSQLLSLNCIQNNFRQNLSLGNAAIEAMLCLYCIAGKFGR